MIVPVGVAMIATLYSLWSGESGLRSLAWVVTFLALWVPFMWFSQRRRES